MTLERGFRRIVLVVSVGVFAFYAWQVWEVVDLGRKKEARWKEYQAWKKRECPRILASQVRGPGYETCSRRPITFEEFAALDQDIPPSLDVDQNKGQGDAPLPLRIWWPWRLYWETRPAYTVALGTALSVMMALVPWVVFYLLRWIAAGFRASP